MAACDDSVDFEGEEVAVVGSGSSNIQVVASAFKDLHRFYHQWAQSSIWDTASLIGQHMPAIMRPILESYDVMMQEIV